MKATRKSGRVVIPRSAQPYLRRLLDEYQQAQREICAQHAISNASWCALDLDGMGETHKEHDRLRDMMSQATRAIAEVLLQSIGERSEPLIMTRGGVGHSKTFSAAFYNVQAPLALDVIDAGIARLREAVAA